MPKEKRSVFNDVHGLAEHYSRKVQSRVGKKKLLRALRSGAFELLIGKRYEEADVREFDDELTFAHVHGQICNRHRLYWDKFKSDHVKQLLAKCQKHIDEGETYITDVLQCLMYLNTLDPSPVVNYGAFPADPSHEKYEFVVPNLKTWKRDIDFKFGLKTELNPFPKTQFATEPIDYKNWEVNIDKKFNLVTDLNPTPNANWPPKNTPESRRDSLFLPSKTYETWLLEQENEDLESCGAASMSFMESKQTGRTNFESSHEFRKLPSSSHSTSNTDKGVVKTPPPKLINKNVIGDVSLSPESPSLTQQIAEYEEWMRLIDLKKVPREVTRNLSPRLQIYSSNLKPDKRLRSPQEKPNQNEARYQEISAIDLQRSLSEATKLLARLNINDSPKSVVSDDGTICSDKPIVPPLKSPMSSDARSDPHHPTSTIASEQPIILPEPPPTKSTFSSTFSDKGLSPQKEQTRQEPNTKLSVSDLQRSLAEVINKLSELKIREAPNLTFGDNMNLSDEPIVPPSKPEMSSDSRSEAFQPTRTIPYEPLPTISSEPLPTTPSVPIPIIPSIPLPTKSTSSSNKACREEFKECIKSVGYRWCSVLDISVSDIVKALESLTLSDDSELGSQDKPEATCKTPVVPLNLSPDESYQLSPLILSPPVACSTPQSEENSGREEKYKSYSVVANQGCTDLDKVIKALESLALSDESELGCKDEPKKVSKQSVDHSLADQTSPEFHPLASNSSFSSTISDKGLGSPQKEQGPLSKLSLSDLQRSLAEVIKKLSELKTVKPPKFDFNVDLNFSDESIVPPSKPEMSSDGISDSHHPTRTILSEPLPTQSTSSSSDIVFRDELKCNVVANVSGPSDEIVAEHDRACKILNEPVVVPKKVHKRVTFKLSPEIRIIPSLSTTPKTDKGVVKKAPPAKLNYKNIFGDLSLSPEPPTLAQQIAEYQEWMRREEEIVPREVSRKLSPRLQTLKTDKGLRSPQEKPNQNKARYQKISVIDVQRSISEVTKRLAGLSISDTPKSVVQRLPPSDSSSRPHRPQTMPTSFMTSSDEGFVTPGEELKSQGAIPKLSIKERDRLLEDACKNPVVLKDPYVTVESGPTLRGRARAREPPFHHEFGGHAFLYQYLTDLGNKTMKEIESRRRKVGFEDLENLEIEAIPSKRFLWGVKGLLLGSAADIFCTNENGDPEIVRGWCVDGLMPPELEMMLTPTFAAYRVFVSLENLIQVQSQSSSIISQAFVRALKHLTQHCYVLVSCLNIDDSVNSFMIQLKKVQDTAYSKVAAVITAFRPHQERFSKTFYSWNTLSGIQILDMLFNYLLRKCFTGNAYQFMGALFLDCLSVYLKLLDNWITTGEIYSDILNESSMVPSSHQTRASVSRGTIRTLPSSSSRGPVKVPIFLTKHSRTLFSIREAMSLVQKANPKDPLFELLKERPQLSLKIDTDEGLRPVEEECQLFTLRYYELCGIVTDKSNKEVSNACSAKALEKSIQIEVLEAQRKAAQELREKYEKRRLEEYAKKAAAFAELKEEAEKARERKLEAKKREAEEDAKIERERINMERIADERANQLKQEIKNVYDDLSRGEMEFPSVVRHREPIRYDEFNTPYVPPQDRVEDKTGHQLQVLYSQSCEERERNRARVMSMTKDLGFGEGFVDESDCRARKSKLEPLAEPPPVEIVSDPNLFSFPNPNKRYQELMKEDQPPPDQPAQCHVDHCSLHVIIASIVKPLTTLKSVADHSSLNIVFNDFKLMDVLNQLRLYFFLLDGEWSSRLVNSLCLGLAKYPPSKFYQHTFLNHLLAPPADPEHFINRLSFIVNQSQVPEAFDPTSSESLSALTLSVDLDWPINTIVLPKDIKRYSDVFDFFISIKRASWSLQTLFFQMKMRSSVSLSGTHYNEIQSMRHTMLHFVSSLENYIVTMLEGCWTSFKKDIASSKDVKSIQAAHGSYVRGIIDKSFLRGRSREKLNKGIIRTLGQVHKFCYTYQRGEWKLISSDAETASSDTRQNLVLSTHSQYGRLTNTYKNFLKLARYLVLFMSETYNLGYHPQLEFFLELLSFNSFYFETPEKKTQTQ